MTSSAANGGVSEPKTAILDEAILVNHLLGDYMK